MGAEKWIPFEKAKSTNALIDRLKKEGHQIWAVEQSSESYPYYLIKRSSEKIVEKITLVFGNEVRGLSPAILKRADKILEIPMFGKKESLNVAVAFGIIVFSIINR